jgi:hypothetical protein
MLSEVHAESTATKVSKQMLDDGGPSAGPLQYASKEEIDEVIGLLRKQLGDDKVTTDKEDCLGHGQSPNTYHGAFRTSSGTLRFPIHPSLTAFPSQPPLSQPS